MRVIRRMLQGAKRSDDDRDNPFLCPRLEDADPSCAGRTPSSIPHGKALVEGCRLTFAKLSTDKSRKCSPKQAHDPPDLAYGEALCFHRPGQS